MLPEFFLLLPMPANVPSPYDKDHPIELIQARIREKRLYEARFLFRQLGDEIDASAREALQANLTGLFNQVEQLRGQAREQVSQKNRDEAEKLYAAIERIAIDMPGLTEEKQALTKLEATAVSTASTNEPQSVPKTKPAVLPISSAGKLFPGFSLTSLLPLIKRLRHQPRYWGWAALALVVLFLTLLLFFPVRQPENPVAKPAATEQAIPQSINIRPMVASGQETVSPSPPPRPAPNALPAGTAEAVEKPATKEGALHLGALQIETSAPKP